MYMPEMKFYDDESKNDRVQALYTKIINEDKADFLLSPYSSGLARSAAVVSEQNGKVMITAGARMTPQWNRASRIPSSCTRPLAVT